MDFSKNLIDRVLYVTIQHQRSAALFKILSIYANMHNADAWCADADADVDTQTIILWKIQIICGVWTSRTLPRIECEFSEEKQTNYTYIYILSQVVQFVQ